MKENAGVNLIIVYSQDGKKDMAHKAWNVVIPVTGGSILAVKKTCWGNFYYISYLLPESYSNMKFRNRICIKTVKLSGIRWPSPCIILVGIWRDIKSSPEVLYCKVSRTKSPRPITNNQLGTDTVTANYSTKFIKLLLFPNMLQCIDFDCVQKLVSRPLFTTMK